MKKLMLFAAVIAGAVMLTGCGDVDENKTPAEIKAEAVNLDAGKIKDIMEEYKEAIEEKSEELKDIAEDFAEQLKKEGKDASGMLNNLFSGKSALSPEAQALKDEMTKVEDSLRKLTANLKAYTDALKEKGSK